MSKDIIWKSRFRFDCQKQNEFDPRNTNQTLPKLCLKDVHNDVKGDTLATFKISAWIINNPQLLV